jgi:hypothetical protein
MSWYKIELQKDDQNTWDVIYNQFEILFHASPLPKKLAMFEVKDNSSKTTFYFPPDSFQYAEHLFKEFGGVPCDKPIQYSLRIILADENNFEPELFCFNSPDYNDMTP